MIFFPSSRTSVQSLRRDTCTVQGLGFRVRVSGLGFKVYSSLGVGRLGQQGGAKVPPVASQPRGQLPGDAMHGT